MVDNPFGADNPEDKTENAEVKVEEAAVIELTEDNCQTRAEFLSIYGRESDIPITSRYWKCRK